MDSILRGERSRIMAAVKSRGNRSTELKLIELLRAAGITGWRRHQQLIGKPDFLWRKQRVALFVDGCFWHGCPLHARIPKSRLEFWVPKLERNRLRDRQVTNELRKEGWRVLRLWECSLTTKRSIRTIRRIIRSLEK